MPVAKKIEVWFRPLMRFVARRQRARLVIASALDGLTGPRESRSRALGAATADPGTVIAVRQGSASGCPVLRTEPTGSRL